MVTPRHKAKFLTQRVGSQPESFAACHPPLLTLFSCVAEDVPIRGQKAPHLEKKKSFLPVLISLSWRPSFLLIFKISCLFAADAPEKTCKKTVFPFQQAPTVIMCTGSLLPSAWFLTFCKETAHSHHSKVTETEVPWQRLKLDNNAKFSANVGLGWLRPSSLHRMLSTSKIHPTKRKVAKQTRHTQGFFLY